MCCCAGIRRASRQRCLCAPQQPYPRRIPPPTQSKDPVYVPATIFLVTDHLYHLLVKNYMRRDKAEGGCPFTA